LNRSPCCEQNGWISSQVDICRAKMIA